MKYLIVLCAIATLPLQAEAQSYGWAEGQTRFVTQTVTHCVATIGQPTTCSNVASATEWYPEVHLYGERQIAKHEGLFVWAVTSGGPKGQWGETLVGRSIMPTKYVQIDLGGGVETTRDPWRVMGSLWTGNRFAQVYGSVEDGGSGKWYLFTGNMNVIRVNDLNIGLGWMDRRFIGAGPRAQIDVKGEGTKAMVWTSVFVHGCDKACLMMGLRIEP